MGSVCWRVKVRLCLSVTVLAAMVISVAAPLLGEAAAASAGWSKNVRVNIGPSPYVNQREPSIAVDAAGRIMVGWFELGTADGNNSLPQPTAFSRSLDGGMTWAPTTFMSFVERQPKESQSDPWLGLDGQGRLYFSRLEFQNGLSLDPQSVVVSRSDDGGAAWGQPGNATMTTSRFLDKDSLTTDGTKRVYVAYTDAAGSFASIDLRIVSSGDGGVTWSSPATITDSSATAPVGVVLVARPGGEVHALWIDLFSGNIFADRSFDGGLTWGKDVRVNDVPGSAAFGFPSVTMSSKGALFVAWVDGRNGNRDIFASRSDDGGSTWSAAVRVNDDRSTNDQDQVSLAMDGNDVVHAAWVDFRTGNYNIFSSSSKDGKRWSANERVTDAESVPANLAPNILGDYIGLAADRSGNVFAAWTDGRNGNADIYFALKPAATTTISAALLGDVLRGFAPMAGSAPTRPTVPLVSPRD